MNLEEQIRVAIGEGRDIAILNVAADPNLDPVAMLDASAEESIFFWQQPSASRAFVGFGSAWDATADSGDRFANIKLSFEDLARRCVLLGIQRSPFLGAGFAFSADSQWSALPPALARLPRLAYVRDYEGTYWQVAAPITDPVETAALLVSQLDNLRGLATGESPDPLPFGRSPEALDDPIYRKLVESAIQSIERGEFAKVVLARSVETPATPELGRLLARLGTQHPEAASFAIGDGQAVFCGATPELLVRWSQGQASSVALAGTVARGQTPQLDTELGRDLSSDPKELAEHQFVIDHVVDRLRDLGLVPTAEETDLMKLSAVQHLRTTVTATGALDWRRDSACRCSPSNPGRWRNSRLGRAGFHRTTRRHRPGLVCRPIGGSEPRWRRRVLGRPTLCPVGRRPLDPFCRSRHRCRVRPGPGTGRDQPEVAEPRSFDRPLVNQPGSGRHSFLVASRFFSALASRGIEFVAASPGSRSTPLIVAAARTPGIRLEIIHDERVAGFVALGYGKQTRKPAVLVCTSGSAGSHYLPAVLEAHHTGVPLIAMTADRPSGLQAVGAPQTVDQTQFFSGYTRMSRFLPDMDKVDVSQMDLLATDSILAATTTPGPVHINWPFSEPLEPGNEAAPQESPEPHIAATDTAEPPPEPLPEPLSETGHGFIVVGPDDYPHECGQSIMELARSCGWPVFADIGSGLRSGHDEPLIIPWIEPAFEPGGLADANPPEFVLRIGRMPTAKAFSQWLVRNHQIDVTLVDDHIELNDFTATASTVIRRSPAQVLPEMLKSRAAKSPNPLDPAWSEMWIRASRAAAKVELSNSAEPAIVASVMNRIPSGCSVHLASSMPIRHADGFAGKLAADVRVHVSRGTNGIDGTIATTLGEAHGSNQPAVAILGDIAFLHDVGGLLAAGRSGLNLTVVVIDNGGGGIFSFLPIANELDDAEFDRLFHTPHGTNIRGLADAAGARLTNIDQFAQAIARPGLDVIVIETSSAESTDAFRAARAEMTLAMTGAMTNA